MVTGSNLLSGDMAAMGRCAIRVSWRPQRLSDFDHVDHAAQCVCVHPQSGTERLAIFVSRGFGGATAMASDVQRPTRPKRIPTVLTVTGVPALLGAMTGVELLLAKLL